MKKIFTEEKGGKEEGSLSKVWGSLGRLHWETASFEQQGNKF